ncbi:iron-containing redox enzyme family protein [Streptomyces sp. JJ38]|uniref:iron-containing redox enzyme family protein n=1 Tax=Streptomyces sp. JJ38 TaxID=2738128 RepID=UPI0027DF0BDB|nr:iron-containing redox enzyme family protein [Streptomyces sp. JJ38]
MTAPAARPSAVGRTLRARLRLTAPALHAATGRLWHGPGLARRYPEYLRLMHGVVRASVPLMSRAAERCSALGPDPVAAPLARYLAAHIEEERGHDDWLLGDLAALGADPAAAAARPPHPAVAALAGAQYYWIEHHHPVTLLGYIAVLEGNAPSAQLADHVIEATGAPDAALRTVRAHAELDGGHTEALYALLDGLDLTGDQADAVVTSGLYTAEALVRLFDTLTGAPGPGAPRPRSAARPGFEGLSGGTP